MPFSFVTGHDFSRAANAARISWAAPAILTPAERSESQCIPCREFSMRFPEALNKIQPSKRQHQVPQRPITRHRERVNHAEKNTLL